FERLIRLEAGDRSGLDAIISSWLSEARQQFEVRSKQSAFKAMSHLKGLAAEISVATSMVRPSDQDPGRLDVVGVFGTLGLRRLRPGAVVKFASRRLVADQPPRQPTTLRGEPVEGFHGLRLDAFCSQPLPEIEIRHVGDAVHY